MGSFAMLTAFVAIANIAMVSAGGALVRGYILSFSP